MMKIGMYLIKIVTATIIAITLTSCNWTVNLGNSVTGSGNIVKEERKLNGFDKVEVKTGLDCEIQQADNFQVMVQADDNVIKDIKTVVENGTLKIYCDISNFHNVTKKIIVSMPNITSLESSSGSTLKSINTLIGNNISLKSSSGSEMNVNIEADTLSLETSSGSEQNIRGKALLLYTASSSGSSINAENLLANDVKSQSSSGSSTDVHAILTLDAKASSGSSIEYKGTPKQVTKEESSGGSVSK